MKKILRTIYSLFNTDFENDIKRLKGVYLERKGEIEYNDINDDEVNFNSQFDNYDEIVLINNQIFYFSYYIEDSWLHEECDARRMVAFEQITDEQKEKLLKGIISERIEDFLNDTGEHGIILEDFLFPLINKETFINSVFEQLDNKCVYLSLTIDDLIINNKDYIVAQKIYFNSMKVKGE